MLYSFSGYGLRAARRKLGYTQERAAELIGVSVRAYRRWEAGAAIPQARNLSRTLDVLCLRIDDAGRKENE